MFQRDNEMRSIVLSDAQARDQATRHFFNRALREVRESAMLRNNPPDVVFSAFSEAFFKGAIKMFQRDNEMKSIVLSDTEARDRATRHFFNRALREVRESVQQ